MELLKIIFIIIGILIIGWLVTNNIYTTYDSIVFDSNNYKCNDGIIELIPNVVSEMGFELRPDAQASCSQSCSFYSDNWKNYLKRKNVIYCSDDDPICDCKASFYSYYITPLF